MHLHPTGEDAAREASLRRLFEEFVGAPKRAAPVAVALLVEPYLADLRARSSAGHAKKVAAQVRRVAAACPNGAPAEVLTFRARRLEEPMLWRRSRVGAPTRRPSHRTVNAEIAAFGACLTWAAETGLVAASPLGKIRPLPEREGDRRKRRRALDDVEIAKLFTAADELDALYVYPQAAMWRVIVECGLRWSEVAHLKAGDLQGGVLVVRASTTKSRRSRRIPVSPALAARLKALRGGEYLFRSPSGKHWAHRHGKDALEIFYAALQRAGIPRRDDDGRSVDIHALRMTCASRLQRRKVPVAVVAKILGHADVRLTVQAYSDFGVEEVRRAVERAW